MTGLERLPPLAQSARDAQLDQLALDIMAAEAPGRAMVAKAAEAIIAESEEEKSE